MRGVLLTTWCVLLCSATLDATPDSLVLRRFTVENGLHTTNIRTMTEDAEGFLWFGSEEGLIRFDGYTFTLMEHASDSGLSLSGERIQLLYTDRSGGVWIAGSMRLYRYQRRSSRLDVFPLQQQGSRAIPGSQVFGMFETADGMLHVVTDRGISTNVKGDSPFAHTSFAGSWQTGVLSEFSFAEYGQIVWINAAGNLLSFDRTTRSLKIIQRRTIDPLLQREHHFRAVVRESDRSLLIVNRIALYRYDLRTGKAVRLHAFSSHSSSSTVRGNDLWIGCVDGTVFHYALSSGIVREVPVHAPADAAFRLTDESGIPPVLPRQSMMVDSRGLLWYHMPRRGLSVYNPRTRKATAVPASEIVTGIEGELMEDRSGCIWFAAPGRDLLRIEPQTHRFSCVRSLPPGREHTAQAGNNVRCFLHWRNSEYLVGSLSGLYVHDMATGRSSPAPFLSGALAELHNFPIWSLARDGSGNLWIGTGGMGLIILDPASGKSIRLNSVPPSAGPLTDRRVRCIEIVEDRSAWVGTWEGLNHIDLRTLRLDSPGALRVRTYRHDPQDPASLSNDLIFDIHSDKDGQLWIATEKGLNRFHPESQTFSHYFHSARNPASIAAGDIRTILEDRKGTLWFGSHGAGLSRFNSGTGTFETFGTAHGFPSAIIYCMEEDSRGRLWMGTHNGLCRFDPNDGSVRNYGRRDGLQHAEFNTGASLRTRSGHLLFGGLSGFNVFHPDSIRDLLPLPLATITGILIGDENLPFTSDEIILPENRNSIAFEFSAQSNFALEANRYWYMLEGADAEWVESGGRHYASYPQLEPGRYRFRLRAINSEGSGSAQEAVVLLTIEPPWWLGVEAKIAYGFGLLLLVFAVDRVMRRRVLARERQETSIREAELRMRAAESENKALLAENRRREEDLQRGRELQSAYAALASAHEELKVTQDRLSTVVNGAPVVLFALDAEGRFTLSEGMGLHSLGLKSGDMVGASVFDVYRDSPDVLASMRRALRGEEFTVINRVGDLVFETRTSTLRDAEGNIIGMIGVAMDITERRRTEEMLARRTEDLETIDRIVQVVNSQLEFENVVRTLLEQGMRLLPQSDKCIALLFDQPSGHYRLVDTIGYDPERVIGITFSREELSARYVDATQHLESGIYILRHRADLPAEQKLGDLPRARSMLILSFSIDPEHARDDGYFVFDSMTDDAAFGEGDAHKLTRFRQHAISALARAANVETLRLRNEEILRTQEQLVVQEKLASLGRLTAGIAHEIQNPLNFINNFAEVTAELLEELLAAIDKAAERQEILEDLQRSVEKVQKHGKRAQGIVRSMMMHARTSSEERQWTDINALLRQAVTLAEHSARSNRAVCDPAISLDLDPAIPQLQIVPQELSRVFLNLLENAMDAICERKQAAWPAPHAPEVVVSTSADAGTLQIRIRDNGIGIPSTVLPHIFEPFFTTKPPGRGTGLGLSICYEIVRQHYGGELTVESRENEYTEFILTLPVENLPGGTESP